MKPCILFVSSLCLFLLFSCTPKDPKEVLRRVDSRIYYLDQAGLSSLVCRVSSPYIEEMFARVKEDVPGSAKVLDRIKVETDYYWLKGHGGKYVIKGMPEELSALRRSVFEVYNGTDILVNPPSELGQFDSFTLSLARNGDQLAVSGVNPDLDSNFREYHLTVRRKDWMILERRFVASNFVSHSVPTFEVRDGKRCPVRIETDQEDKPGEPGFKSLVEISYQEKEGFWLVKKLTYQFARHGTGDIMVGPVEVDFESCLINPPMDHELFNGGKVQFMNPEPGERLIPKPGKSKPKRPSAKPKAKPNSKKR